MFSSILRTLTVGLFAASASVAAVQLPPHAARGANEHFRRTPGQVVTKCTVPNTAALTFVCTIPCREFEPRIAHLYDLCRTMALGFTCTTSVRPWLLLVRRELSSSVRFSFVSNISSTLTLRFSDGNNCMFPSISYRPRAGSDAVF